MSAKSIVVAGSLQEYVRGGKVESYKGQFWKRIRPKEGILDGL